VTKYDTDNPTLSRVNRNEDLYKEINKSEIDNFNLRSNATVIGNQANEIDVEKIKKILDNRYNETAPKRKSIKIEPIVEEPIVEEATTKEYDLNLVLEKAKDDKEENYVEERNKKIRDTQFDILKTLNVEEEKKSEEKNEEEQNLLELINTITLNETKNKTDVDVALDLFEDLKGDENTEIYEGLTNNVEKVKDEKEEKILEKEHIKEDIKIKNMEKDENFWDEDSKLGIGIKVLIILIIILFLIGIGVFVKSIFF